MEAVKLRSFDKIYMKLAIEIGQMSHCVKKQVGSVIAKDTRVISLGYNGPPTKSFNCNELWPKTGCQRTKTGGCFFSFHAEQNAITYALKNNITLEGASLYVSLSPCLPCARLICSVGIQKVFYHELYSEYKGIANEDGIEFLKTFGVTSNRIQEL